MDFSKPPKGPLVTDCLLNFDFRSLHPDIDVRHRFYRNYLEPKGHAKALHGGGMGWDFSQEFIEAVKTELPLLKALIAITL